MQCESWQRPEWWCLCSPLSHQCGLLETNFVFSSHAWSGFPLFQNKGQGPQCYSYIPILSSPAPLSIACFLLLFHLSLTSLFPFLQKLDPLCLKHCLSLLHFLISISPDAQLKHHFLWEALPKFTSLFLLSQTKPLIIFLQSVLVFPSKSFITVDNGTVSASYWMNFSLSH